MKKIMISATHSGAGKTTITLGIMHALTRRKLKVQPYKVGPDYIDTGWHKLATGCESYNLDAFMIPDNTIRYLFHTHAQSADINVIEGVMGLYDGYGIDPNFCSSAGMAKLLHCPIILVVDGKSVSTSLAATVKGFQQFQPDAPIVGVITNRVNAESHYQLLKSAIETYTHLPVLGRLPNVSSLTLPERYLGLVPIAEQQDNHEYWEQLADLIEHYIDIEQFIELSEQPDDNIIPPTLPDNCYQGMKIAIARDDAFHFYYQDNLALLQQLGVTLMPFSPLYDEILPSCDAIYIGGGFPELFAQELTNNTLMRQTLRLAHQQGKPIYAECGGLMYLGDTLVTQQKQSYDMVGIFAGESQMSEGLKRFGYCEAAANNDTLLAAKGEVLRGHEFHHSEFITDLPCAFSFTKTRDKKIIKRWQGGYQLGNTLASYLHVHFYQNPSMLCHWLGKVG